MQHSDRLVLCYLSTIWYRIYPRSIEKSSQMDGVCASEQRRFMMFDYWKRRTSCQIFALLAKFEYQTHFHDIAMAYTGLQTKLFLKLWNLILPELTGCAYLYAWAEYGGEFKLARLCYRQIC